MRMMNEVSEKSRVEISGNIRGFISREVTLPKKVKKCDYMPTPQDLARTQRHRMCDRICIIE